MTRKVLYRKYRPTQLADVVGQSQVTGALANAIQQGKIGHAYLFIGPRGTGKTSVARIFAHAVNDFSYDVEDNYLDIIEIDAASNTGVDNIRELREKSVIAPTKGKYKVYIIDEVHMLTKSASNALLKTLEEPPEHVIFIMATTDAHKVPITISSRTQVFTFRLADAETMFQYLRSVAEKEQIKITDDALRLVVRRGGGSFRDSMSLLDQIATLSDGEITAELLSQALGLPQEQLLKNLLQAYTAQDTPQIQATLKDLLNSGIKPEIIASELIEQIMTNPAPEWLNLLARLPDVQPPFPEAKLLLALLAPSETGTSHINTSPNPSTNPQSAAPSTATTTPDAPSVNTADTPTHSPAAASPAKPSIREQLIAKRQAAEKAARLAQTSQPATSAASSEPDLADGANLNATFAPVSSDGSFDWEHFLDQVKADNGAVYAQLCKTTYEFADNILHIYPEVEVTKKILDKSGNRTILARHLGGLDFEIHDIGAKPAPKDATLSKLSAIMGNIKEIKGDSPF